jgi:hypothetical protein
MSNRTVTQSMEADCEPDAILVVLTDPKRIPQWAPVFADEVERISSDEWRVKKHSGAARPGHFSDSRISGKDEFAGAQGRLLEIRGIGWKHLPAGYRLPQHLNGSHVGKLAAQALVMLFGCGKPHSVICGALGLVPEDQDDFVIHVNGEAAEHRASVRRQRSDCVEDELMRNGLALLEWEDGTSQRRVSARLRHRTYDIAPFRTKQRQALVEVAVAIEELLRGSKGRAM